MNNDPSQSVAALLSQYRADKAGKTARPSDTSPAPAPVAPATVDTAAPADTIAPAQSSDNGTSVADLLAQYKANGNSAPAPAPVDDGIKGGFIGRLFTGNTQKFGKTAGEAFAAPENANLYSDAMKTYTDVQNNLMKAIKTKKAAGQDASRLEAALDEHTKEAPKLEDFTGDVINKTPEQVLGEAAGTVLEATAGGALESGAKTAVDKTLTTGQKLFKGAKVGAAYGAASGGSNSMQEGNDAGKVLEDTAVGGLIGAGTGGLFEGAAAGLSKIPFLKGKQGAIDHYVNIEKENFAKPSTLPQESTYKGANIIFNNAKKNGTDLAQEAVNNGIRHDAIIEGGKYNTVETAANLRQDAMKASNELIRPALKAAEPGVQRVGIGEIRDNLIAKVKAIPNSQITDEDRKLVMSRIEKKYGDQSAAAMAHPEGYTLTDLHDNKIIADQNGKYKPLGNHSENIRAQQSRTEGDIFRKLVEDKAPAELDIKGLNGQLQKKYQLADYLTALNGKKVPKGIVEKAIDSLGKLAGARLGYQFGGGLLPGAIGYHLGGVLLDTFQGLSNPLKGYYLDMLEKQEPALFKEFQEYVGKQQVESLMRKKLPAATTIYKGPEQNGMPYTPNQLFSTSPVVTTVKKAQ